MTTLGSSTPAHAYSSSMCDDTSGVGEGEREREGEEEGGRGRGRGEGEERGER